MTDEQIKGWRIERDIARDIKNEDERAVALQRVYDHRDDMMMTCIAHQSSRVKDLTKDVATIKEDLKPCMETDEEFRKGKERIKGAKAMWAFLRYVAAIGGGATIMKLLMGGGA